MSDTSSPGGSMIPASSIRKDKLSLAASKVTQDPSEEEDDDEKSPPPISSDNLLRRASFKKILEDLSSSADSINKTGSDPLVSAAAATLQAHQAHALQQAGVANPAILPILQNLSNVVTAGGGSSSHSNGDITQQLAAAMMLPNQLSAQQQLQSALINAGQSPLIASSLANQQFSSNILSSALLNAAANPLSNLSAQLAAAANSPLSSAALSKAANLRGTVQEPSTSMLSPGSGGNNGDEPTRKREVRLMKNREAARECRRKKKEYIRCLENRVAVLESQNQALIGELRALKELYLPKNQE